MTADQAILIAAVAMLGAGIATIIRHCVIYRRPWPARLAVGLLTFVAAAIAASQYYKGTVDQLPGNVRLWLFASLMAIVAWRMWRTALERKQ